MSRRWQLAILLCFLLSGAAGLIYEVVWSRLLGLLHGNTALAVSIVLAAFMAGLALGSGLWGRYVDGHARPLRLYAFLEWGIGGYALLLPWLFDTLIPSGGGRLLSFGATFWLLLPPTVAMGGTLPILSTVFWHGQVGAQVGRLYAWNTFGGVVGVALAGFGLLPVLGMQRTVWVAAALNALAGGIALLGSRTWHGPVASASRTASDWPPGSICSWPSALS